MRRNKGLGVHECTDDLGDRTIRRAYFCGGVMDGSTEYRERWKKRKKGET